MARLPTSTYTTVFEKSFYRHPRTGRPIPVSKEKQYRQWYRKRYRKRPVKERWLYVVDRDPTTKRAGAVSYAGKLHRLHHKVRLTMQEFLVPVSAFTERHVRSTLVQTKAFQKIWDNWGGVIRVRIAGVTADGRRVRRVLHLPFHRQHWEFVERRRHDPSGRELFRRWLTASILAALRASGLRLSDRRESQGRISRLQKELRALQSMTEFVSPQRMGGHIQQMKWKAVAIRKQKASKQILRPTIRIEKLV